jgi:hypothetical protein
MKIELRGTDQAFKLLVKEIMSGQQFINRDEGHPLYSFVQQLEDQLEETADREMDFICIDELFEE